MEETEIMTEANPEVTSEEISTKDEEGARARRLLDDLLLQMLRIIQEKAILSHQLGKQASQSRMILAKIRMQHGRQRTSADALLPRWRPYKALCRIFKACTQWGSSFEYKRHPVDPDEGFLDPLTNMFGSIVPFSLRVAATNWERVVNLSVECANVQQELLSTMSSIRKLQHSLNQR